MNLRVKLTGLVALTIVAATALPPALASGAPVDDKRRQAAALEAQISANGDRISALGERINGARYRLAQAQAGIAEAERRTADAQAQTDRIEGLLSNRAADIYKGATAASPLDAINVKSVTELGARTKYAAAAAEQDGTLLEQLQRAREELAVQQASLEQQKAAAEAERATAESAQRQIAQANAQQQALLGQVKGQIASLVAAEQSRRAAAARAQAAALLRSTSVRSGGRTGNPERFPNIPAPSPKAAVAIAFARAQLGKPYRYATSGPDTYDCSGLTAAAWGAAGVSLPHYSGAQYSMLPHVPLSALQPGDLVFRGPGGSQHVSLYIGGGLVITAPQTGDVVKIASMGSVMGAARPG